MANSTANPPTTHVVEIETGIGEPAFIPLALGSELQPISVGKKGMWKLESARVLDVHAFLYFDGKALFIQSADEASAVLVDGFKVGKAWTELHAPAAIEVGGARLRYRSLQATDSESATLARPPAEAAAMFAKGNAALIPMDGDEATKALDEAPVTLPKADRPFKPGQFASRADDESTRVAPLETSGARGVVVGVSPLAPPRPAAGRPVDDDAGRSGGYGAYAPPGAGSTGPFAPVGMGGPMQPGMMQPGMMQPGMMQPGMMQPGMSMPPGVPPAAGSMPPGGMPMPAPSGPGLGGSGAYPNAGQSGAYGSMAPYGQGGPIPPNAFGPTIPAGVMQGPGAAGGNDLRARFLELSPPKKILVFLAPLCLVSAAYVLLFDDDPPPRRSVPHASADAGAREGGVMMPPSASVATGNTVPPAPCPPGFQSSPGEQGGTCMPIAPQGPADAGEASASNNLPVIKDAGAEVKPTTSGTKTLERMAVDAYANGDYAKAATIYDQLVKQNPNNGIYADALRILRQKLDGGAP